VSRDTARNPFSFGDLALDEAFTDREDELRELTADMRNGQNVLVYAPRRYGKSSLVLRVAQEAQRSKVLVGYCDLMKTPTKERLAAALAKTIYADIASPVGQAFERAAALFRGLRVVPSMEVDPVDGTLRFSFRAGRRGAEIDETIERLLELPAELAVERRRPVVIVFDEFQEVVAIDPRFPNLMRSVFQAQPEVGHVYLGSKRHVLQEIFSDRNQPFWRSAKQIEIGMIEPARFARFLRARFEAGGRSVADAALERLLGATGGHPYATQELSYYTWELVAPGSEATPATVERALDNVLRSEHNHLTQLWDDASRQQRLVMLALAEEPSASPYSEGYRREHELPGSPSVQSALGALIRREVVGRDTRGRHALVEPFLGEWLLRGQRQPGISERLRG
jgi:AAA+ ATPase superfamily predicted ATPase